MKVEHKTMVSRPPDTKQPIFHLPLYQYLIHSKEGSKVSLTISQTILGNLYDGVDSCSFTDRIE